MKNWKALWQTILGEDVSREYQDKVFAAVEKELEFNASSSSVPVGRRWVFMQFFAAGLGAVALWFVVGRNSDSPPGEEDLGVLFVSQNEELLSEDETDILADLELLEELEEMDEWANV